LRALFEHFSSNVSSCVYRVPAQRKTKDGDEDFGRGSSNVLSPEDNVVVGSGSPVLTQNKPQQSPPPGLPNPQRKSSDSPQASSSKRRKEPALITPLVKKVTDIDEFGFGGYTVTPYEVPTAQFWRPKPTH